MTFRGRLVLALLGAALIPLIFFALGVRREMTDRLAQGEAAEDRQASSVASGALEIEGRRIARQLQEVAGDLARDPRAAGALRGEAAAKRWLINFADGAMRTARLDVLQVQDSTGIVLSAGQYRALYGQPAPLMDVDADSNRVLLARQPSGSAPVLARAARVTVSGRTLVVSGGTVLDSFWLASLAPDTAMAVSLVLPGEQATAHPVVARFILPLIADSAATDAVATIMIWRRRSDLATMRAALSHQLATALALSGILAVLLALLLGSRISRPLRDLTEQAEGMDLEHLDQDFASGRPDEIGRLSTALGGMQHRLRRSLGQLREAERRAVTGDLARQVNHDIKNGLAPIRNVLRHLSQLATEADAAELQSVFRERESTLTGGVAHLEEIARSYAQLSPAAASGEGSRLPLADTLAHVIRDIGDARVTLHVPEESATASAAADGAAVRRIMHNLIANALESLPAGEGSVEVGLEQRDGMVMMSVADTGHGMTAAELDRAFRDFHTTKPTGTGLGLSSVRRLVMDLGGGLRAKSSPGVGSRFEVSLPVAAEPPTGEDRP